MDVPGNLRGATHRTQSASSGGALLGCTHCGHISEAVTEHKVGHLTSESCPECGNVMRVVDLAEAQQLTRERFLAAHWKELAAAKKAALEQGEEPGELQGDWPGAQRQLPEGFRRPLLQRDEFDSHPRELRDNLRALEKLLADCEAPLRRRIILMFGELLANWQRRFAGEPVSVVIEVMSGSVRMSVRNSSRLVTPTEWNSLISAAVVDLVDAWGIDRRLAGRTWFEFVERPQPVSAGIS